MTGRPALVAVLLVLAGCSGASPGPAVPASATTSVASPTATPTLTPTLTPTTSAAHALPDGLADRLTDRLRTMTGADSATGPRLDAPTYAVQDWTSDADLTVLATFALHFPSADTGPWSEGTNERFVHVTRAPDGTYLQEWSTGR